MEHENQIIESNNVVLSKFLRNKDLVISISLMAYTVISYYTTNTYSKGFFVILILFLSCFLFFAIDSIYNLTQLKYYKHFLLLKFSVSLLFTCTLLHLGQGNFVFFLLFIPSMFYISGYILEEVNNILPSFIIGVVLSIIYFSIQIQHINNNANHIISTYIKSSAILILNPLIYLFLQYRYWIEQYSQISSLFKYVGRNFTSSYTSSTVLNQVLFKAKKIFKADVVNIRILEPQTKDSFVTILSPVNDLLQRDYKPTSLTDDEIPLKLIKIGDDVFEPNSRKNQYLNKIKSETEGLNDNFLIREKIKSTAAVILRHHDEKIGIMFLNYRKKHYFPLAEQKPIRMLAEIAALAVINIREKDSLLQKLISSMRVLSFDTYKHGVPFNKWLREYIDSVVDTVGAILDEELIFFAFYNKDSEKFRVISASTTYQVDVNREFSIGDGGITVEAFKEKETKIMHSRILNTSDWKEFGGSKIIVESALATPLIVNEAPIGVLLIESKIPYHFSELNASIVEAILLSVSTRVSQVMNDLVDNEDKNIIIKFIMLLTKELSEKYDLSEILTEILQFISTFLNASDCKLYLVHEKQIRLASSLKKNSEDFLVTNNILTSIIKEQTYYYNGDTKIFNKDIITDNETKFTNKSILYFPLFINKTLFGILYAEKNAKNAFHINKFTQIDSLAPFIYMAILNNEYIMEIANQNKQKSILLAELQHRVKNNLAIVLALVQNEIRKLRNEKGNIQSAETILKELNLRINSVLILHSKLLTKNNDGTVQLSSYLLELIDQVANMFSNKNIKIIRKIENHVINVKTAQYLGLIVNESLLNIYKHAFSNIEENCTISITSKSISESFHELVIEDNGIGFDYKRKIKEKGLASSGLNLIASLAKQIDASADFNSINNGTQVSIKFPLY